MSERDELTMLVLGKTAPRAADAVLAAGYRKVQVGEREKILALIDYAENLRGSSMYCKVTTYELRKALGLSN